MTAPLVLLAIVLAALSGVPALFLSRRSTLGQTLSVGLAGFGAAIGLAGVAVFWTTGAGGTLRLPWSLIAGADFQIAIDGLSALFLVPIFVVSLAGNVYGLEYWRQTDHPDTGCKLRLFYGLLTAGMALVVIAQNSILFLMGWEVMTLAAFFLVATEEEKPEARAAAWIYLVASHVALLCLFVVFALLRMETGSFTLEHLSLDAAKPIASVIFAFALVGFGVKAGIMPLHVWLPGAHSIAPSHVSAIMSGVIIKMGIYGIVRLLSFFPEPPLAWGGVLLGIGAVTAVLGIVFAAGQRDLKRMLAYCSIENIGIIVMGIGVALAGRSLHEPAWIVLGLGGALLHVWNHALFKALLFLAAGSVIHQVHTRQIDRLGGLARRMPWTALAFLVGAVAICGLPPFNGFVSEFLVYLGLFGTIGSRDQHTGFEAAAFAAPALALTGALAVACFVKVYGAVFLGTPRSAHPEHAHESGPAMLAPMALLAGCCVFIGLAPPLIVPALDSAVQAWMGTRVPALGSQASLGWISILALALLGGLAVAGAALVYRLRNSPVQAGPTWGCGYLAPTPRIQYTASSFAQMIVELFRWALRPRTHRPGELGLFPQATTFHSEVPDTVLDDAVLPTFRFAGWLLPWFRVFQQGNIQTYLLYIFAALFVLLLWR